MEKNDVPGEGKSDEEEEDKGDPEMAPVYLKRLLPVLAEVFHSSLAPSLRWFEEGVWWDVGRECGEMWGGSVMRCEKGVWWDVGKMYCLLVFSVQFT